MAGNLYRKPAQRCSNSNEVCHCCHPVRRQAVELKLCAQHCRHTKPPSPQGAANAWWHWAHCRVCCCLPLN